MKARDDCCWSPVFVPPGAVSYDGPGQRVGWSPGHGAKETSIHYPGYRGFSTGVGMSGGLDIGSVLRSNQPGKVVPIRAMFLPREAGRVGMLVELCVVVMYSISEDPCDNGGRAGKACNCCSNICGFKSHREFYFGPYCVQTFSQKVVISLWKIN